MVWRAAGFEAGSKGRADRSVRAVVQMTWREANGDQGDVEGAKLTMDSPWSMVGVCLICRIRRDGVEHFLQREGRSENGSINDGC